MSEQDGGTLVYQVDIETAKLITGSRRASVVLEQLNKNARGASSGLDGVDASGKKASGSLGNVASNAEKAGGGFLNASRSADSLGGGLNKLTSLIRGYITIQAAMKLIKIADDMTMLEARVRRLSSSTEEATITMASLSAIAANTGSSLASTEKLWETLTSSLKEAGASNLQVLRLTDTLQKIGVVGGSSAEEMSNALRQFGQSIAGGIVRAEEFNSVLENMPELARQIAAGLGLSMGELRKRMLDGKLTAEDALNAIQKRSQSVNEEFDKMPVTVERAKNSLDVAFKNVIGDLNESIQLTQTLAGLMQSVANNLNFYNRNVGDSARMPKLIELQKKYNEELKNGQQWYETDSVYQQRRGQAAFELKRVEQEIAHIRAKSAKDSENASKPIEINSGSNPKQDELIKKSERRLALSKLEGEARARLEAQYAAEDAGFKKDDPRTKRMEDEAAATYSNLEAQKKLKSETKSGVAAAESAAQKVENLRQKSELAASSTKEFSREQAILTAQQSLGKGATQAQVALAGEYAAKAWDAAAAAKGVTEAIKAMPEKAENKSYAESMQNLKAALDAGKIDLQEYNTATEKMALEHQNNLAKINAQSVVNPVASARAEVDPVQQLANENAQKLALIQQFETEKGVITQRGLELMRAANTQYEQQRIAAQWEIFRNQNAGNEALAASFDAFAGNASNAFTGIITGSMSAEEAARSLGSTVLNSLVNAFVQMGVDWVKSAVMGSTAQTSAIAATTAAQVAGTATTTAASTAAAAATTTAWTPAAIVASIGSFGGAAAIGIGAVVAAMALSSSLAGKRKNGGPVRSGSMYQVGEGGLPEIYQASTGKQYMIPGDNGKVISNKDMQGGGGINVNVSINNTNGSYVDHQVSSDGNGGVSMEIFIADMDNGGPMSQAISRNHQAPRRATQ
ncbi:tape measure protein [Serratia bockelmannii]|uniref:tape measure protein n=1 Tax=Serratia bockelmannii TaxID=2703793 RepID=UPI003FA70288